MNEVKSPNAEPIQQTATQADPYTARPEDFKVRSYNDPMTEPFHGQSTNSPEAQKRSREEFNRGSVRAEGNVNHAGPPHTRLEGRER